MCRPFVMTGHVSYSHIPQPASMPCYAWVDHWCKQIVYIVQCMWLLHISIYVYISCGMLACSACMWQVFSSLSEPVVFGLKVKWLQARLENYYYDLNFVTALNAFESTIEQSANDKATHHTPYDNSVSYFRVNEIKYGRWRLLFRCRHIVCVSRAISRLIVSLLLLCSPSRFRSLWAFDCMQVCACKCTVIIIYECVSVSV